MPDEFDYDIKIQALARCPKCDREMRLFGVSQWDRHVSFTPLSAIDAVTLRSEVRGSDKVLHIVVASCQSNFESGDTAGPLRAVPSGANWEL
jgi:hypothetical protein